MYNRGVLQLRYLHTDTFSQLVSADALCLECSLLTIYFPFSYSSSVQYTYEKRVLLKSLLTIFQAIIQ